MKIHYAPKFKEGLETFHGKIREKLYKQVSLLQQNLLYPSLHAKKYKGATDTWQARVDKNVRFYFKIDGDTIILLSIKKHPK